MTRFRSAVRQHGFRAGLLAARWGVYFVSGHYRNRPEWRASYEAGTLHALGVNHLGRTLVRSSIPHPNGGRDALE